MSNRTCAACGKFVAEDYSPDEGKVVTACEECEDHKEITITLRIRGKYLLEDALIDEAVVINVEGEDGDEEE